jgi:hypothetical protein
MTSFVLLGNVLEGDTEHLLMTDGSLILARPGLPLPVFPRGSHLMVAYTVLDDEKLAEAVTVLDKDTRSVFD